MGLLAGVVRYGAVEVLQRAARAVHAASLAVAALVLVPPFWLAAAVLRGHRASLALQRAGCRLLLRIAGCRLVVEGAERLPAGGPLVLASNHSSYADVPALLALLPIEFVFVAKKEVLSWPLVGTLVRRAGHVTVDRWDARQGVADAGKVARALEEGGSVLFFPDGTFTSAAGLRPFRLGAFQAAAQAGAPVVPLALQGTRAVLPDKAWLPRPRTIKLWIGSPVAAEGDGWREVVALRDRVADAIAERCGEPRLDLPAGGPSVRPAAAPHLEDERPGLAVISAPARRALPAPGRPQARCWQPPDRSGRARTSSPRFRAAVGGVVTRNHAWRGLTLWPGPATSRAATRRAKVETRLPVTVQEGTPTTTPTPWPRHPRRRAPSTSTFDDRAPRRARGWWPEILRRCRRSAPRGNAAAAARRRGHDRCPGRGRQPRPRRPARFDPAGTLAPPTAGRRRGQRRKARSFAATSGRGRGAGEEIETRPSPGEDQVAEGPSRRRGSAARGS
jgi:1-acyl-sn-glycerol-3-phosphate acyltransferase